MVVACHLYILLSGGLSSSSGGHCDPMVTLITLVCRGCFLGTALVSSVLLPAAGVICLDLDDLLIQNE